MKLRLDRKEKRELNRLLSLTQDKKEYRRALGVLMRAQKKRVIEISKQLNVSIDAVERWLRAYRKRGIKGIRARKPSGRPPEKKRRLAETRMKELLKQDPQAFGFLKGRWVIRDISKALSTTEGIKVSRSYVHDMLRGLGLTYKRPKLTVKSDDPNYHRKAREVRNYYKKAASMLAKKRGHGRIRRRDLDPALPSNRSKMDEEEGAAREDTHSPGYNRRKNAFVTLLWPKKYGFVWNRFEKRRSREFKLHLSNLIQYDAKRHGVKRIILFMDHDATCHKTKNVKRFIRDHDEIILRTRMLPKRAPQLNPTEWIVNRPLKSVVCSNRSYKSMDEVARNTTNFLRQHRTNLRT